VSRSAISSDSSRNDAVGAPQSIKPVTIKHESPLFILNGCVADALLDPNPVRSLLAVQGKNWFGYHQAQQRLVDDLWKVERDEFDYLMLHGVFTDRLQGCISHHGEIFKRFIAPSPVAGSKQGELRGEPLEQPRNLIQHQRIAWAGLMTEELQYLADQKEWTDDQLAMAHHACAVLNLLTGAQGSLGDNAIPMHLVGPLVHAMSGIVRGSPLVRLINKDCSSHEALAVQEIITLAISFDDVVISEEVVRLVPIIFETCQARFPEEFSMQSPEGVLHLEEWEDAVLDDEGQKDDDLDVSCEMSAESRESAEYEELSDAELIADPSWRFSQLSSAEDDIVMSEFVVSLGLCLRELRRLPTSNAHVASIRYVLDGSPMNMPLWQELVDTLIAISPRSFEQFLPQLLRRCLDDDCGGLCVLGIADYAFRKKIDPEDGPLPSLVYAMQALGDKERQSLLTQAAEFLEAGPELFRNVQDTEEGLKVLKEGLQL
jgi:hypothetical protein